MNVKSIATKAMVAAALAVTTVAPAFANNNQYLNNLAMQMYMQNQANAGLYNNYGAYSNPYAYGAGYGGQLPGAPLYGAATRGVYGGAYGNYGLGNIYGNAYNRYNNRGIFNRYWRR